MNDPGEKYADRVDPEHKAAMEIVASALYMMEMVKPHLERFLDAERQMHVVGHILDPTLYRDAINSQGLAAQVRIARAALSFVNEFQQVRKELTNAQHPSDRSGDDDLRHGDGAGSE